MDAPSAALKQNHVGEACLYGVPIVSLVIDGKERLCLAQISNTLLKSYSYNEIHNRRVALGITCVQCTPVQLELLRRAGAMPISSRRCGMITKREAERLCKSFLGEHSPPKLPENFAFDVSHDCAWGCRGSFIPARYNSSRAKCIKCSLCSMYFSPNKFIFHSHRASDARYLQPDAANFNSWRRHLRLTDKKPADDISHAWEDVKAMFNGGSRKRMLPPGPSPSHLKSAHASNAEPPHKSARCEDEVAAARPRSFPLIPVPSKSFSLQLHKLPPPLFPPPYPFPSLGLCPKKSDDPAVPGLLYPAFPVFWPGPPGAPYLPHKPPGPVQLEDRDLAPAHEAARTDDERSADESAHRHESAHRQVSYVSAFRPVVRDAESIAKLYGARCMSPDSARSEDEDPDVDVDETQSASVSACPTPDSLSPGAECVRSPAACTEEEEDCGIHRDTQEMFAADKHRQTSPLEPHVFRAKHTSPNGLRLTPDTLSPETYEEKGRTDGALRIDISVRERPLEHMAKGTHQQDNNQEELQKQLVEQVELRKKLEREFQHFKDNFQDQMKRELSYREEMVQQLHIVREAHDALHHFSCKMLSPRQCSGACTFKPPLLPP